MIFRLDRFFFDEKDIFTLLFGIFVVVSHFMKLPLEPFRTGSLVVLFLFLIVTRSMVNSQRFEGFCFIVLSGLIISMVLSPYGLAIYLFIAMMMYVKLVPL